MSQTYEDRPTLEQWNELVQAVGSVPKIVCGSYTGNFLGYSDTTGSQHISLGYQPSLVLIFNNNIDGFSRYSACATPTAPVESYYQREPFYILEIDSDGFTVASAAVTGSGMLTPILNASNTTYQYLAIN